jgi:YggT family protein
MPSAKYSRSSKPLRRRRAGSSTDLNVFLYVVDLAAMIYAWLIVASAVLSWFRVRPGNPLFMVQRVLAWLTEPYLRLFRRLLPRARIGTVGVDLSSFVGLIVLFIVIQVVVRL